LHFSNSLEFWIWIRDKNPLAAEYRTLAYRNCGHYPELRIGAAEHDIEMIRERARQMKGDTLLLDNTPREGAFSINGGQTTGKLYAYNVVFFA